MCTVMAYIYPLWNYTLPIFTQSVVAHLYPLWNCNNPYFHLINGSSSISTVELKHPLFSPNQWRLVYIHYGTATTPIFTDQWRLVYVHCGTATPPIFTQSVVAHLYALWNCNNPYFHQSVAARLCPLWNCNPPYFHPISGGSSISTVELQHSLFSPDQWRLVYVHCGIAPPHFHPISGSSSISTMELQHSLFSPDQWRLVYVHYRTATPPVFTQSVAACLYPLWNGNTPYFPPISGGSSISTVERQHPLFSPDISWKNINLFLFVKDI